MNLTDMSRGMNLPIEEIAQIIEGLRASGFIFSMAPSASELGTERYPVRIVYQAPTNSDTPDVVSCGPFPVKREVYEQILTSIPNVKTRQILLGFFRLAYEKTGVMPEQYGVEADEEDLYPFLSMMKHWDVAKPHVADDFVWILPSDSLRREVGKMMGRRFTKHDYSWWNVTYSIGERVKPQTPEDLPGQFGLMPAELIRMWSGYMPMVTCVTLIDLYIGATTGGKFRTFKSTTELVEVLEAALERNGSKDTESADKRGSFIDRELLIKELCDFNNLTYPVNSLSTLDYLTELGFIKPVRKKKSVQYALAKPLPASDKVLSFPSGWSERMEKYLVTGSILFSYLTLDELA